MPLETKMTDTSVFFLTEGRKILTAAMITYYHQGMDFPRYVKNYIKQLVNYLGQNGNYEAKQYINSFEEQQKNIAGCKQAYMIPALKLFAFKFTRLQCWTRERKKHLHRTVENKIFLS